jgi:hypothetical protein
VQSSIVCLLVLACRPWLGPCLGLFLPFRPSALLLCQSGRLERTTYAGPADLQNLATKLPGILHVQQIDGTRTIYGMPRLLVNAGFNLSARMAASGWVREFVAIVIGSRRVAEVRCCGIVLILIC